jgi:ribosomal protein S18 acetylase RimI-like enzyme
MNTLQAKAVSIKIRSARMSDIDAMVDLLQQLFAIEKDFCANPENQRKGLLQLFCQEQALGALVAEADGKIVGMCTCQVVVSTAEGGRVGWVEDLVVLSEYRGRGIGRLLLLTLEQWARNENLKRLQLLADQDNIPALGFYAKQQWRRTRMVALRKAGAELL